MISNPQEKREHIRQRLNLLRAQLNESGYLSAANVARSVVEDILAWLAEAYAPIASGESSQTTLDTKLGRLTSRKNGIVPRYIALYMQAVGQATGNPASHGDQSKPKPKYEEVKAAESSLESIVRWFLVEHLQAPLTNFYPRLSRLESGYYQGRDHDIAAIYDRFEGGVCPVVISGPTGLGKTELARQYADRYREKYTAGILLLDASVPRQADIFEQIKAEFIRLRVVSPTDEKDPESAPAAAQSYWKHWNSGRVLVIFDDVSDGQINATSALFPRSSINQRFDILVTSQPSWPIKGNYKLQILDELQSLDLFHAFLEDNRVSAEKDTVVAVARWLGFMPIALELVARYMKLDPNERFAEVLERLQSEGVSGPVLAIEGAAVQRNWMTSFLLMWDKLSLDDRDLLHVFACFPAGQVSLHLVEAVYERARPLAVRRYYKDAYRSLGKWNILRSVQGHETVEIHDLIRLSTRHITRIEGDQLQHVDTSDTFARGLDLRTALGELMSDSAEKFLVSKDNDRLRDWLDYAETWAEIGTCPTIVPSALARTRLLFAAIDYRNEQGAASDVIRLTDQMGLTSDSLQALSSDGPHEYAKKVMGWRAEALKISGSYELASVLLRQMRSDPTLTTFERGRILLQEADVDRLQGSYDSAASLYAAAVDLSRSVPLDSDIGAIEADAEYGIARIMRLRGKHGEAREAYQQARQLLESCTPKHKAARLGWTEFGLGEAHRLLWNLDKSREHYDFASDGFGRNLEGQSYTLWGRGECQRLSGQFVEARESYDQSLQRAKRTGDVRSTVWALLGLGCVALQTKDVQLAISRFETADGLVREDVERAHLRLCQAVGKRKLKRATAEDFGGCLEIYTRRSMAYCIVQVLINLAFVPADAAVGPKEPLNHAQELAQRYGFLHELDVIESARKGLDDYTINLP